MPRPNPRTDKKSEPVRRKLTAAQQRDVALEMVRDLQEQIASLKKHCGDEAMLHDKEQQRLRETINSQRASLDRYQTVVHELERRVTSQTARAGDYVLSRGHVTRLGMTHFMMPQEVIAEADSMARDLMRHREYERARWAARPNTPSTSTSSYTYMVQDDLMPVPTPNITRPAIPSPFNQATVNAVRNNPGVFTQGDIVAGQQTLNERLENVVSRAQTVNEQIDAILRDVPAMTPDQAFAAGETAAITFTANAEE